MASLLHLLLLAVAAAVAQGRSTESDVNTNTLKFLHLIWRHGDRSPTQTFPLDKNREDCWPQGWGELSELGMQQAYDMGTFMNERYGDYLSTSYNSRQVYVRADHYNRTLMTAAALMNGFYQPLTTAETFRPNTTWFPFPVHSIPNDPAIWPDRPCPAFDEALLQLFQTSEVKKIDQDNQPFLDLMRNLTGAPLPYNVNSIWDIWDPILAEKVHDKTCPPPSWLNDTIFDEIERLYDLSMKYYYYTRPMQQMRAGMLTNEINERMMNVSKGQVDPRFKMFGFSGHDTTILAFLEAYDMYSGKHPPYGSMLMVELHEVKGDFYVQVFYKNSTDPHADPYQLDVPKCGKSTDCTLDKFVGLTSDIAVHSVEEWKQICSQTDATTTAATTGAKAVFSSEAVTMTITLLLMAMKLVV